MKLTTTLNKIRACNPCADGWKTLLKHVGNDFDPDAEINLLTILESNGVVDMLWSLRATHQDSARIAAMLAIEFAQQALPIFEESYPADARPRKAIQAARDYLDGKIGMEILRNWRDLALPVAAYSEAARAASCAASAAVAYANAADVVPSYATHAANAAACAAGFASYETSEAAYNKARELQAAIIRSYLEV